MILILTSSPCRDGESRICRDNGLMETLWRCVKTGARTLFVSADPDDEPFSDYCASSMYASMTESGLELGPYLSLDSRTKRKTASLVSRSDFIVIGGGHVPTQNAFLSEIGLRDHIRQFTGTVMGISAGSMNCADIVYAQPEEPGESIDPNYIRFLKGLGLTKINILPHYQKTHDLMLDGQRLYEDITFGDSHGHAFYAFPDGTYLLSENGRETIFGDAWLIQNGHIRKICSQDKACHLPSSSQ